MINSPVRYQGSKRKLVDRIQQMLPTDVKLSIDVFGGSGVVCANLFTEQKIYNELSTHVTSVVQWLSETPPKKAINTLIRLINKWKLDRENEAGFFAFRDHANKKPAPEKFFLLHRYAHSNLLRFNSRGLYNASFGFRQIDLDLLKQEVIQFHQAMSGTEFQSLDFLKFMQKNVRRLDEDAFLYFDPPYLASGAMQYKGGWSPDMETRMLRTLDVLDERGCKFMLSNVLAHRQFRNDILNNWLEERGHNVVHLDMKYKFAHIVSEVYNGTDEVIITNY